MSTQQRMLTFTALVAIMNKRVRLTSAMLNRKVIASIVGNGNVIDVTDKAGNLVQSADGSGILRKRIFNLNATSEVAMKNPANIALLQQIKALHTAGADGKPVVVAGQEQVVHDLINEFLNKTQVTFSLLSGTSLFDSADLTNGSEISGKLIEVVTDKGSLLTIEPSTISVAEAIVPDAEKFDFSLTVGSTTGNGTQGTTPPPPPLPPNMKVMYQGTETTVASLRSAGWQDADIKVHALALDGQPIL